MTGYRVKVRGGRPAHRLQDYVCTACSARWEQVREEGSPPCPDCGAPGDRAISAAKVGTVWGAAATRGKSDERAGPGTLDTSAIADGMPVEEWKKKRKAMWRDIDRSEWKRKVG